MAQGETEVRARAWIGGHVRGDRGRDGRRVERRRGRCAQERRSDRGRTREKGRGWGQWTSVAMACSTLSGCSRWDRSLSPLPCAHGLRAFGFA